MVNPTGWSRFFVGATVGPEGRPRFFIRAVVGLAVSLDGADSLPIGGAVLTGADITVGFFGLSL